MEKLQLYHLILTTVKNNHSITLNQLSWLINSSLGIPVEEVKDAAEDLMYKNTEVPRCLNYFKISKDKTSKNREIAHLRLSSKSHEVLEFLFKHQEEVKYEIPELTFRKEQKNASLLKKA